jgi:hypothetical protein
MKRVGILENLFYKGTYSEVLTQSVDSPNWSQAQEDIPFVVGALSFTGRIEEAEIFIQKIIVQRALVIARFFLGVGYTRLSRYPLAQKVFAENFRATRRKKTSDMELFFSYQGLSFFRFFSGRLKLAERSSKLAFQYANKADYLYGKVLSTDVRAHILIQLGEVSRGIKLLSNLKSLCEHLDNSSLPKAILISEVTYKSRFGLGSIESLQGAIKNLDPGDNYSFANLLLEHSRQLAIRGNIDAAYKSLDEASRIIYSNQNRRQEVVLNLRYAQLMYLSGDFSRGLNAVRAAKRALDTNMDSILEVEALGMEYKFFLNLGMKKGCEELLPKLEYLSKRFGNNIQIRIYSRNQSGETHGLRKGEDLIGDLMDQICQDPESAISLISKSEYYGLFYEVLLVEKGSSVLYLDLQPGTLTLFDRGNVIHKMGLTPLLKKIILCLAKGVTEKGSLVSQVWGYKYDPLRHDSIVYNSMVQLRKLLGNRAHWLVTSEGGYGLQAGIIIKSHSKVVDTSHKPVLSPDIMADSASLNLRQIKILQFLKKNECIDVQKCKKLFNVSDITASRDLSALTKMNTIARIGKGRATQYMLLENLSRSEL